MTLTPTVCLSEIRPSFSSVKPSIPCSHSLVLSFPQILCPCPLLEPSSLSIELTYCRMLSPTCLPQGRPLPAQTFAPNPSLWALFGMPQPHSILWLLIKYLTHGPWFLLTQQLVSDANFNWFSPSSFSPAPSRTPALAQILTGDLCSQTFIAMVKYLREIRQIVFDFAHGFRGFRPKSTRPVVSQNIRMA